MTDNTLPAIETLVPHSGPALLLDCVIEAREDGITAAVTPGADHPYLDPALGGVPVWVGIELMAQAVAAHAGLEGRQRGEAPRVGYLVGTRRFTTHVSCFPVGTPLEVEATRLYLEESGLGAYDCRVRSRGAEWARATITVFQNRDTDPT